MKMFINLLFLLFFTILLYSTNNDRATILYFNDAHQIYPVDDELGERGGVARLKTIVDKIKSENKDTMVIFGGDLGGGSFFGNIYHGFPIIEAFNKIPIDLANFGQHDFDFGSEVTQALIDSSNFQWISSNLVDNNNNPFAGVDDIKIVNICDIRIGFIALTDAMNTTTQDSLVFQNDLFKSAEDKIDELIYIGVDLILAITQTGLKQNEQLLENNPDIKAIFSEEIFEDRTNIHYIKNRPIITPCGNMGSVVRLDIYKNLNDISLFLNVYSLDSEVSGNYELAKIETKYKEKIESDFSKPIATLITPLDAGINGDFKCRWGETNIGNLITDSFRAYHKADIAFINGGGIRSNIYSSELTIKDALAILPFGNTVCLIKLSGRDIISVIKNGLSSVVEKGGQFLQVSGASYEYDWEREPENRLISVMVNNKPINVDKKYTVALPNFILMGGDKYNILKKSEILVSPDSAPKDVVVFSEYCKRMKTLNPKIEGRILIKNKK